MKNSFKLKALCAALAVSAASVASASQIYLDFGPGGDFTNPDIGKYCPTCTGLKNEIGYVYQSTTTITDLDGNGIDAGDSIKTSVGLFGLNLLGDNKVDGFQPGQNPPANTNSDNGLNTSFWMSFRGVDLEGTVGGMNTQGTSSTLDDIPLLQYNAGGLIEMLLTFDGVNFINFMNLLVGGGGATGVSTVLFGQPDFTGVDAQYNNLIHAANGVNCGGATGLQTLASCGATINWVASQDTNVTLSQFSYDGQRTYIVTTNHDGSLRFDIPEPSMLLLMGGALLGLGLSSRRRAKQD